MDYFNVRNNRKKVEDLWWHSGTVADRRIRSAARGVFPRFHWSSGCHVLSSPAGPTVPENVIREFAFPLRQGPARPHICYVPKLNIVPFVSRVRHHLSSTTVLAGAVFGKALSTHGSGWWPWCSLPVSAYPFKYRCGHKNDFRIERRKRPSSRS
jgi:hypothetical protein